MYSYRAKALLCLILVCLLAGCAAREARENLARAEIAYTTAVETAIELRDAGIIERGSDIERRLTDAMIGANLALIEASQAVRAGDTESASAAIRAALVAIARITRELEAARE